ncbi:RHS repeat domain-containing protein [Sessilibacter sp. MAH4]
MSAAALPNTTQYAAAGFLVAHIEGDHNNSHQAKLNTTQFKRDALGRLLEKFSPDGEVTTFAYDKHGRLAQANNASQQLRFHYNASGRLIEEHQGEQVLRHSYNSLGLRTQTTLPSGDTLKYRFNNIGQLQSASFNDQLITQLKHNKLGQIAERKQGELTSEYDYDAMGRLSEHRVLSQAQKHAVIQRNYRYTQAGNLESIDDLNKGSTQYFYDALDRLKQVEGFVNEQFDFDPANNLIQQSEQPKAEQAQQNPNQTTENSQEFANSNIVSLDKAREQKAEQQTKGNRLAFQGDRHFTYDQRGNLIKEARGKNGKLITEFRYNAQNQLIEIDHCGTKTQYQYDALGRRIKKISADTETQFLWNGDVLLSETQRLKTIEKDESKSTEKTAVAKIYVFEPNSFKPLAQIQNNEIYHYHLDHLGTPQELTNNRGDIVWSAQYKTYGNLALKTVEIIENNLRFQGQYFDQETGLHYNRHRYYNPNTGQFTQQDPIGLLGGLNNYQYANNPIQWVDPFGLACKEKLLPRFKTQHDAARHASTQVLKKSISEDIEYGGMIYRNNDGTFGYTGPIKDEEGSVDPGGTESVPEGTSVVAYWHTHGADNPDYDNENFSNYYDEEYEEWVGDIPYYDYFKIDGYVATPKGQFKHYDHISKKVTTLSGFSL